MLICGEPSSGLRSGLPKIIYQAWQKPPNVEGMLSLFMQKRLEVFLEFLLSFLALSPSNLDSQALFPTWGPNGLEPV